MTEGKLEELIVKTSAKLDKIQQERSTLGADLYEDLESSLATMKKVDKITEEEFEGELSKIDDAVHYSKEMRETIAELTGGVTAVLGEFGQITANAENYTLSENVIKFFNKNKANRMRLHRISQSTPEENMGTTLDYCRSVVRKLSDELEVATAEHAMKTATAKMISQKIDDYEPQQRKLKEELDVMYEIEADLKGRMKVATSEEEAKLAQELDTFSAKKTETELKYRTVLARYKEAKEAYAPAIEARDTFADVKVDITTNIEQITEKVDNLTDYLMGAPVITKIALSVKGAEEINKAFNATVKTVSTMYQKGRMGVRDATLSMLESETMDAKHHAELQEELKAYISASRLRTKQISELAEMSESERYGARTGGAE